MRILAIDHGEKRIGIALSDPTGAIASPLTVLHHISRPLDVARVLEIARQHDVLRIIVGQSLDESGRPNAAGRRAVRFAQALQEQTDLPVELWDESLTTHDARAIRIALGLSRKRRAGHHDALAAAILLQSYLEARRSGQAGPTAPNRL